MQDKYKKLEGETLEEYEFRICHMNAQTGELETWNDVADVVNEVWGTNYTESKVRKDWSIFMKMLPAYQKHCGTALEMLDEIKEQRRELEKAKVKFRDERNEVSRLLREQARKESFKSLLIECAEHFEPIPYEKNRNKRETYTEKALIVHLTDLHAGIEIDNCFNQYNKEILMDRICTYLDKIFEVQNLYNAKECIVVMGGDLISGAIHSNLRLENNQNVIEQTMYVSDMLSQFISEIADNFEKVRVYSSEGNHGRLFPNKEESLTGENFDSLIPYILKAKLQLFDNVAIIDSQYDPSFGVFECFGKMYVYTHGDKDNVSNVVQNMTLMIGKKPDCILMGHRHTNGITTVFDCKVVESGCVSGLDRYCMDRRLKNHPEQMLLVCDKNGIDCAYDVQLDG